MIALIMTDSILSQLHIDPDSPEPKYLQLARQLEAMIRRGVWSPQDRLPSDTKLVKALAISSMTARQAMGELVAKGLITRIQGRGTFLLPHALHLESNYLRGMSEDLLARHAVPSSRILEFKLVKPTSTVRKCLGVASRTKVLFIRRLRLRDGQPVTVQAAYLTFTDLTREELEAVGSLYTLLEQKGVRLAEASETLNAAPADDELAELLHVAPGSALLCVTRITLDEAKRPVEYVESKGRGDTYAYSIRMRRQPG